MEKPTLLYYEILKYSSENLKILEQRFNVVRLQDPSEDTPEMLRKAEIVLAPLGYYFGKEKMDQAPRLKILGSNTTGHPHIDIDYAQMKRIKVVTLKNHRKFLRTITPTAELTWGLIIALTRNLMPAYRSVQEGRWERWPFGGKKMLSRMTLGIAGLGRLGSIVASYGLAFGMEVYYYDPFVEKHPKGITRKDSLEALVKVSDVVTIHIPHEPETENLFNKKILQAFKEDSFLINTSRGELLDQEALIHCLENGRIAGAAVDVLSGEFEPDFKGRVMDHPLIRYSRDHSNLIITPHIGGSTNDAWSLTQEYTIKKIIEAMG